MHLDFYSKLSDLYDIYFICDTQDDLSEIKNKYTNVNFFQIEDSICLENGYHKSCIITMSKVVVAWDKALYYFIKLNNSYDYVWFLEDDVFIPTIDTISNMDRKYPDQDYLCPSNGLNESGQLNSWWWPHINKKYTLNEYKLPWSCSMVCAVRMSKKLLENLGERVNINKELLFIETMFNTVASNARCSVVVCPELSTIVYSHNWRPEHIRPENLYHPIKDPNIQTQYRQKFLH